MYISNKSKPGGDYAYGGPNNAYGPHDDYDDDDIDDDGDKDDDCDDMMVLITTVTKMLRTPMMMTPFPCVGEYKYKYIYMSCAYLHLRLYSDLPAQAPYSRIWFAMHDWHLRRTKRTFVRTK